MEPLLLTPGPLTTSPLVRAAMQRDLGSRDPEFTEMTARVRRRLAGLAPQPGAFTAIPLQGSGTFAVEAMLGTLVPPDAGAAVLVNGVYGARAVEALRRMGRTCEAFITGEGGLPDLDALAIALTANPGLTHVFTVHSETTTGQLLPLKAISDVTARAGRRLLVDAMSSLGAIPMDGVQADAIASSANKCLEGVPGLGFVLVRNDVIAGAAGLAPSLSLDLHAQWSRLEKDGQFRFTPPTHVLAALDVALDLHEQEGGVTARGARYAGNMRLLLDGMRRLGFVPLLPDERQGPIIATFHEPASPAWSFPRFYDFLRERGFAIYPGSLAKVPSFRVGCIGQVFPADIVRFIAAVAQQKEATPW